MDRKLNAQIEAVSAMADTDNGTTAEVLADTLTPATATAAMSAIASALARGAASEVNASGTGNGLTASRQARAESVNLTGASVVACMFAGELREALSADGTPVSHFGVTVRDAERLVLLTLDGAHVTMSIGTFGRYAIADGCFEARYAELASRTVRAAMLASPSPRSVCRKWYAAQHPTASDAALNGI